jgi:hypothetical protein
VALAARWKAALAKRAPGLRVRRNYPYIGKNDGLTSSLRRRFPPDRYVGIEIELNQAWVLRAGKPWRSLRGDVVATLQAALRSTAEPVRALPGQRLRALPGEPASARTRS